MNDFFSTRHPIIGTWLLAVMAWTSLCGTASSQVTETDNIRIQGVPVVRYHITLPAKSPERPWMKISLLPPLQELQSGNAAPLYYRAILSASQQQNALENSRKFWDQHQTWMNTPLSELPIKEVEQGLQPFHQALEETGYAARRSYCEWDFPLKESKTEIFTVMFNEVQECRTLGNLLTLRIRLRMAQGRYDEAVADLQTGYALARNVGRSGFMLNALVGEAIALHMSEMTLELMATDDCPNLYWSISELPNPLIDPHPAIEQEKMAARLVFPEMYEALESKALLEDAYWDDQLRGLVTRWVEVGPPKFGNPGTPARLAQELAWQAMAYSQAPRIKQEMVAELGYTQSEVDAMSDARALLAHGAIRSEEKLDTSFAPLALPYYEAERFYNQQENSPPKTPIFTPQLAAETWLFSPQQFHGYMARSQERYQMLRIVESLRDYARRHGELPAKLDQLTDLPITVSPVTGKPFDYQRSESDNNQATLTDGVQYYKRQFEIHIRP